MEENNLSENDESSLEESDESSNVEKVKVMTFLLNTEWYAFPVTCILEILQYLKATSIPGTPSFLQGIINIRGNILPVIDLRELFEIPIIEPSIDSKIMVIEIDKKTLGIFVDILGDIIKIPVSSIHNMPSNITGKKAEGVDGVFNHQNQIVTLLNIKKIISLSEFQSETW